VTPRRLAGLFVLGLLLAAIIDEQWWLALICGIAGPLLLAKFTVTRRIHGATLPPCDHPLTMMIPGAEYLGCPAHWCRVCGAYGGLGEGWELPTREWEDDDGG
jgi:hypothetical protein